MLQEFHSLGGPAFLGLRVELIGTQHSVTLQTMADWCVSFFDPEMDAARRLKHRALRVLVMVRAFERLLCLNEVLKHMVGRASRRSGCVAGVAPVHGLRWIPTSPPPRRMPARPSPPPPPPPLPAGEAGGSGAGGRRSRDV